MHKRSDDMIVWGVNALNHGSSLSVFKRNDLISYKFDHSDELDPSTIYKAYSYGGPSKIYWYERPWLKKARQLYAGQYCAARDLSVLPSRYLDRINLTYAKLIYTPHHASHAAAGYYTSPFHDAAVVVLDAIGEFECASIWRGTGDDLKKVWNRNYPNSLGLFYSAFAHLLGYKPILEEHLLQKDSDRGDPDRYYDLVNNYFNGTVSLRENLHRGVVSWPLKINHGQQRYDIAAAVQRVFEEQVDMIMSTARTLTESGNLVYMGGCAMNSKYNKKLSLVWDRVWSLPQPGDPSSCLGAVLYHTKIRTPANLGIVKHLEISV